MKSLMVSILCVFVVTSSAQQLTWAHNIGSPGLDESNSVSTDASGNVYIAGKFSGSNVDFDPGPATFMMSSAGGTDAFVAKYNSAGQFILAFKIGGSGLDEANFVTIDPAGNIVITGFFRGPGVDFDPGPGTQLLNSYGEAGGDPGYGGDMFLAKYTATGTYQWAFHIGGTLLGDNGLSVKADAAGDLYVGGYFREEIDFDPGPGTYLLSSANGPMFVAKFNGSGLFQWALNAGQGDVDNTPFDLFVDAAGNCYVTGFYQGTNIDFDPGPGIANLSSNGGFEMFVSKYNSNGVYQLAFSVGSFGTDVGRGIVADAAGNMYVICDFSEFNVDFDPGPGTALLSSAGYGDVGLAKYNALGQYQWAFRFGGSDNDFGWQVATDGLHLFVTGGFNGAPDMDPSPTAVETLTSSGGYDIFMGKYTFDGEYLCSFKIGSTQDDFGYSLLTAGPNVLYLTGSFQGSSDFDPATPTTNLTSAGSSDAFLAKYSWPDNNSAPTGSIGGINACGEESAQLVFNVISGTAPFTIRYSDGVNEYVQENVQSGVAFNISPQPLVTTTYTLLAVRDDQRCSESNFIPGNSVTVLVDRDKVTTDDAVTACSGSVIQLHASGAQSYSWSPAVGLSDPNIANPVFTASGNIKYYVTGIGTSGCNTSDSIQVNLFPTAQLSVSNDTSLCSNTPVQLVAFGGASYSWSPAAGLNDPGIANPVFTPGPSTEFFVTALDANGCTLRDSVTVNVFPAAVVNTPGTIAACYGTMVQLQASGALSYSWSPASGLNNPALANPETTAGGDITYMVTGTDSNGCTAQSNLSINVYDVPTILLSNDTIICVNSSVPLHVSGGTSYVWSPAQTLDNNTSADPVATPLTETQYYVTTTDNNNCRFLDSVRVAFRTLPVFAVSENQAACSLDTVTLSASGGDVYSWTPDSGLSDADGATTTAIPSTTTTYTVQVTESTCNISQTLFTTVEVSPLPSVQASKSNDIDCFQGFANLSASGARRYVWTPASSLSNGSISNPVASPVITTQYMVKGTSENGCVNFDTVTVGVSTDNKGGYLMPTAFTPNKDGVNDCYGVGSWGYIYDLEFSIFNRWGERIFFTTDPSRCWDGTYKGVLQPTDVFIYMIKAKTVCSPSVFRKGTFTLIR